MHAVSLGRQKHSQVDLELLEERLYLLEVELELGHAVGILFSFLEVEFSLVDLRGLLDTVV